MELPLHLNWPAPGRVFDLRSRADRTRGPATGSGGRPPSSGKLLGDAGDPGGDHDQATTPLYGWLKERGFLDLANPPLRP